MYQQRINGGVHAQRAFRQSASALGSPVSASSHSGTGTPAAVSVPQTRSVTSAAAAALQSLQRPPTSGLSALNTRGRSKAPRELSYLQSQTDSAPQPSRNSPVSAKSSLQKLPAAGPSSPSTPTASRNLFDSKSWIQNSQRRAPSATGLRRGAASGSSAASSPTSGGGSSGFGMTAPVSPSQLATLGSSPLYAQSPPAVKGKTRSSSQLGFRQLKTKSKV
jgi:hypothetical protein